MNQLVCDSSLTEPVLAHNIIAQALTMKLETEH
jgi:hypothetical protein